MDLTRRPSGQVDRRFRLGHVTEREAALYEAPFAYMSKEHVYPIRAAEPPRILLASIGGGMLSRGRVCGGR